MEPNSFKTRQILQARSHRRVDLVLRHHMSTKTTVIGYAVNVLAILVSTFMGMPTLDNSYFSHGITAIVSYLVGILILIPILRSKVFAKSFPKKLSIIICALFLLGILTTAVQLPGNMGSVLAFKH